MKNRSLRPEPCGPESDMIQSSITAFKSTRLLLHQLLSAEFKDDSHHKTMMTVATFVPMFTAQWVRRSAGPALKCDSEDHHSEQVQHSNMTLRIITLRSAGAALKHDSEDHHSEQVQHSNVTLRIITLRSAGPALKRHSKDHCSEQVTNWGPYKKRSTLTFKPS